MAFAIQPFIARRLRLLVDEDCSCSPLAVVGTDIGHVFYEMLSPSVCLYVPSTRGVQLTL